MFYNFPKPPKILQWSRNLDQHYKLDQKILITSGCSFTASTTRLEGPSSWPGFLLDRCGFDKCIDLSYPGVGNEYIANSILNYVEELDPATYNNIIILVCWSGPERREELSTIQNNLDNCHIDDVYYRRLDSIFKVNADINKGEIWRSWKNIIFLQNYLENKKIKFGFSLYCNTVEPPLLPHRDQAADFFLNINNKKIASLKNCTWLHQFKDSFFEYCFFNDNCLADDLFHPNARGSLLWTDQVLLPGMLAKNLIAKR